MITIEIIPDCVKSVIKLKPGVSQPFFLRANIGKTNQTDSLSSSFMHDFEGHYSNYCGYPTITLRSQTKIDCDYLEVVPDNII